MRIVLVHGINQEGQGEATLKARWLRDVAAGAGRAAIAEDAVQMPFYGARLAEQAAARSRSVLAMGPGVSDDADEAAFVTDALAEQATAAGIGAREVAAEQRAPRADAGAAVEQGGVMGRRANAIARLLERVSPLHGDLALRLVRQAYAYLKRPAATNAVDAVVRPALERTPAIVVAHSLGTVVSFKLLRQLALEGRPVRVPLLVTLGSPLSLKAVRSALGPSFAVPDGVGRWVNAVDPDDFVALGRGLDDATFCPGIENVLDVRNGAGDPHAVQGYLRDPRIARLVVEAFEAFGPAS